MDQKALKTAYYANIRPSLEYASIIWSGTASSHLKSLERYNKFLLWLAKLTKGTYTDFSFLFKLSAFLNIFQCPNIKITPHSTRFHPF